MSKIVVAYADSHEFELIGSTLTVSCDAWSIYISDSFASDVLMANKILRLPGKESARFPLPNSK